MADKLPERIVAATRNQKKVAEIERILRGTGMALQSLGDYPDCPETVEDGTTFMENALKKAREVSAHAGLAALADDSGLVVDALGGAPGVYSARYAGPGATDADNVDKLLADLLDVPDTKRTARFVCVMALVIPGRKERVFLGHVEGRIGHVRRGENGFGYDPVFFPEGHDRTFAEMLPAEKDAMSHRGRALEGLRKSLLG